jgi:tetratricopeptide (TPR) repeat protein
MYYLWALVLHLKGDNKEAIRLLEKAVKLAPDYGLFRFKLAEIMLKNGIENPKRKIPVNIAEEFKLALEHIEEDLKGNMASYAGNLLLSIGDAKNAKYFFDKGA